MQQDLSQSKKGFIPNLTKLKADSVTAITNMIELHFKRLGQFLGVKSDSLQITLRALSAKYKLDTQMANVAQQEKQL